MKNAGLLFFTLLFFFTIPLVLCCTTAKRMGPLPVDDTFKTKTLAWERIYSAKGLLGYVKKEEWSKPDKTQIIYHVYDPDFHSLGFITNEGWAFRFQEGKYKRLASSTREKNIEVILGEKEAIRLEPGIK